MKAPVVAAALASILLLTGCSAAVTIAAPETQPGASSAAPARPATPKPVPSSQPTIAAQDASFSQLYATSGFNETDPSSGFSMKGDDPATIAKGLDDLAPAVENRCYPILDAGQVDELNALKAAFDAAAADPAATSDALFAAGKAYFDRAMALCL